MEKSFVFIVQSVLEDKVLTSAHGVLAILRASCAVSAAIRARFSFVPSLGCITVVS
jgi:hypothetical protein